MVLRARALQPDATIAVVAPSAPWSGRSDVERGVAWWERAGYHVQLGRTVLEPDRPLDGCEADRLADLAWAFGDESIGAVQCLHGGFGATHLVPGLPYELIAEHPKPWVSALTVRTPWQVELDGAIWLRSRSCAEPTLEDVLERYFRQLSVPRVRGFRSGPGGTLEESALADVSHSHQTLEVNHDRESLARSGQARRR